MSKHFERRFPDPLRLPGEGTTARKVYDALRKGEPVRLLDYVGRGISSRLVGSLKDVYNCEIRPAGHGLYILVGRYRGVTLIPLSELKEDQ